MDRDSFNSHVLFFLSLLVSSGILIYILVSNERTIAKIDDQVIHTYKVINTAQEISHLVESMLASQRGYILTKETDFLEKFRSRREKASNLIANMTELVSNDLSQSSRLEELRNYYKEYSTILEQRAMTLSLKSSSTAMHDNVEQIDDIKDNILRINFDILRKEYYLLNSRIRQIDFQKSQYFTILVAGIIGTSVTLLLFNGFLLRAQRKQNYAEISLKSSEERYAMAIKGSQDGIFDWDLKTGQVFYSRRFFEMLGRQRDSISGTVQDFKDLLHPEDAARVEDELEKYLSRKTDSYAQEFRLRADDGSWVWINARAYAIFSKEGWPVRVVGAHTDITPIKVAEQKLKAEKAKAEEQNRAKSEFLAHMSHEIRTPLNAISGIAEILQTRPGNLDQRQIKIVDTLSSSVSILKDIINDILDFSKIESGEVVLHKEFVPLHKLFTEIVSIMSIRANLKRLSFIFDFQDVQNLLFQCDKQRLRQILINLIGNAIKFTEKGSVTVKAYRETQPDGNISLRVDVTDTGIGIDSNNFALVFERFKQEESVAKKYEGTGLGLPISKNLAVLMGGDVLIRSEVGKGSTFSIVLPLTTENHMVRGQDVVTTDAMDFPKKITPLIKPLQGKKILIAEDYEDNTLILGYILEDLGLEYDITRNGAEALQKWQTEGQYSLILMDIHMPEMDGIEVTTKIREIEKENGYPPIAIIGMTADALTADENKCLEAGMNSYLTKPIMVSQLRHEILKCFDNKQRAA